MDTGRMLKQQPLFGGTDSLLHCVVLRHPITLLVFAPELKVESLDKGLTIYIVVMARIQRQFDVLDACHFSRCSYMVTW
jgi:hypothetical protein